MEIYDLVGFHDFCKIEMNETEFSAQITFYTEAPVFYDDRAEPPYDISGYGRKCLASLRLVNKAFYAAASKRLFRELHIGGYGNEIKSDKLSPLLELSRSSHATSVKRLSIKLSSPYDPRGREFRSSRNDRGLRSPLSFVPFWIQPIIAIGNPGS